MVTYVALLRAVNVGGHGPLAMAELRRALEGVGLRNVRTYLQSGNVIFDADEAPPLELATTIEARIERDVGPRVGVRVLGADEMCEVVAANPFVADSGVDEGWLHATFLFSGSEGEARSATEAVSGAAPQAEFHQLQLPAQGAERAAFVGTPVLAAPVVYLCLPYGMGRARLNNAYFERTLGTTATTRNWRTTVALAKLSAGDAS